MKTCTQSGCDKPVSKPEHQFCLEHWKANKPKPATSTNQPPPLPQRTSQSLPSKAQVASSPPESSASPRLVRATEISRQSGIHINKVNPILAELGWLTKDQNGWIPTSQGVALGAVQQTFSQDNKKYVSWSESILTNNILIETIARFKGSDTTQQNLSENGDESDFRKRFPADYRTTDGHLVRSKAEMLIDNQLYYMGIVHSYERKLPIQEKMYCDFYLPVGNVYIEYWGYEDSPDYTARKRVKQELYRKYNFNLIELSDKHINNLDDHLPALLLKFGIAVS